MPKYVNTEEFKTVLDQWDLYYTSKISKNALRNVLDEMSINIIWCKDCRHFQNRMCCRSNAIYVDEYDFCSHGRKREVE